MPEESTAATVGQQVNKHTQPINVAKVGVNTDVAALKGIRTELDVIVASVTRMDTAMSKLGITSSKTAAALKAVGGAGPAAGGGDGKTNGMVTTGTSTSLTAAPTTSTGGGGGAWGKTRAGLPGMFANFGKAGTYVMAGGAALTAATSALDNRFDRGMQGSIGVDRLNVLMQQQLGVSQAGIMNQRKPMFGTNANPYRIGGQEGINALMQYQAFTGITATPQLASSVAGIRALTGYSKTTADVLTDQSSALQPQVANRMFNMLGVNAYTYGGGVNDPMTMRKQITQRMGLANPAILKGAMLPGSVTRARLTDAGVPAELQDEILTYAKSQVSFQKKGGTGMYDPSKKADRKRMGIEENFATQQEETDRLRGTRDENFTRRQLGNMAALERNTQTMVKILGSIDSHLSGLAGARASSRSWTKIGGRLLEMGGLAAAFLATGGVGVGLGLGVAAVGSGLTGSGDPMTGDGAGSGSPGGNAASGSGDSTRDSSISIPFGYQGQRKTISEVKSSSTFSQLNPKMQDRLLAMFRANPNLGIGQGKRSSQDQEKMFLSRYRQTDKNTGISWKGSFWEHVSGAAAAPPGRSMHEIGLAADLVGDLGWMNANAAKYGLRDFSGVNNEPWHVQPAELPGARSDYEKAGAIWGTDGGSTADSTVGTGATGAPSAAGTPAAVTGASIVTDAMIGMPAANQTNKSGFMGYIHLFGNNKKIIGNKTAGNTTSTSNIKTPTAVPTGGKLTGEQVAQFAYNAGFRGEDLVQAVAISKRESIGWNPRAMNPNTKTGDRSYGLWQLNTLNSKKGGMMEDLMNTLLGMPKGNTNFDALYDPQTNANMAYQFYKRWGNTLGAWGAYKGQSNTKGADKYLGEAAQAVKTAFPGGYGDPMPMAPSGGGGSTHISHAPTYQITVSPQISFIGTPSSPDLRKIAQEVGSLLTEQVRTLEMRNA